MQFRARNTVHGKVCLRRAQDAPRVSGPALCEFGWPGLLCCFVLPDPYPPPGPDDTTTVDLTTDVGTAAES